MYLWRAKKMSHQCPSATKWDTWRRESRDCTWNQLSSPVGKLSKSNVTVIRLQSVAYSRGLDPEAAPLTWKEEKQNPTPLIGRSRWQIWGWLNLICSHLPCSTTSHHHFPKTSLHSLAISWETHLLSPFLDYSIVQNLLARHFTFHFKAMQQVQCCNLKAKAYEGLIKRLAYPSYKWHADWIGIRLVFRLNSWCSRC